MVTTGKRGSYRLTPRQGVKGRRLTAHLCDSRSSARSWDSRGTSLPVRSAYCRKQLAPAKNEEEGAASTAQRACTGSKETASPACTRANQETSPAPDQSPRARGSSGAGSTCRHIAWAFCGEPRPLSTEMLPPMGDLPGGLRTHPEYMDRIMVAQDTTQYSHVTNSKLRRIQKV